jgi:hypothetical protein
MTDYTATRAGSTRPAVASGLANVKISQWGITTATTAAAGDKYYLVKLPKGAVVVGGRVYGDKLASGATAASESLTVNIGVDQAITLSDGTVVTSASTSNALGAGILSGSAVAGIKPETGYNMPLGGLLMTTGPFRCNEECNAYITVVASAGAGSFSSGDIAMVVDYHMGSHS